MNFIHKLLEEFCMILIKKKKKIPAVKLTKIWKKKQTRNRILF